MTAGSSGSAAATAACEARSPVGGHPRAVALLKVNPLYVTDTMSAFACGDCLPRVREAVSGGGFVAEEYAL